jgi:hypothetical protein
LVSTCSIIIQEDDTLASQRQWGDAPPVNGRVSSGKDPPTVTVGVDWKETHAGYPWITLATSNELHWTLGAVLTTLMFAMLILAYQQANGNAKRKDQSINQDTHAKIIPDCSNWQRVFRLGEFTINGHVASSAGFRQVGAQVRRYTINWDKDVTRRSNICDIADHAVRTLHGTCNIINCAVQIRCNALNIINSAVQTQCNTHDMVNSAAWTLHSIRTVLNKCRRPQEVPIGQRRRWGPRIGRGTNGVYLFRMKVSLPKRQEEQAAPILGGPYTVISKRLVRASPQANGTTNLRYHHMHVEPCILEWWQGNPDDVGQVAMCAIAGSGGTEERDNDKMARGVNCRRGTYNKTEFQTSWNSGCEAQVPLRNCSGNARLHDRNMQRGAGIQAECLEASRQL